MPGPGSEGATDGGTAGASEGPEGGRDGLAQGVNGSAEARADQYKGTRAGGAGVRRRHTASTRAQS
eukprot:12312132-Alexandrium_andersonii.AAC.1